MSTAVETKTEPQVDLNAPVFHGLLAEYEDVDTLMSAAETMRDAGYTKWDCFTPCPIHGLDKAMGVKHTCLPWISLVGGITGCTIGLILVYVTNAISPDFLPYALRGYQFPISGKPTFSLPANIPPIFELTILLSAFGAFFGMLALNLLPRFYQPVFNSRRFAKASDDKFFILIEAEDPVFDREKTETQLSESGATAVEEVED